MSELEGLAKTIFDEVMEEIEEELEDGLETIITKEKLQAIITNIQKKSRKKIAKHTKEEITEVEKVGLGEKLSRVVTKDTKEVFTNLVSEVVKKTYETEYELQNEIVEEVFKGNEMEAKAEKEEKNEAKIN